MLKIQVLGKGLIPRGYGLAPRLQPFPADRTLIHTILQTPGLSIKYLNPNDGKLYDLTKKNCQMIWDKFNNVKVTANKISAGEVNKVIQPSAPAPAATPAPAVSVNGTEKSPAPQTQTAAPAPVTDDKETKEAAPAKEETSPEVKTIKPINAPQNNKNNNNNKK